MSSALDANDASASPSSFAPSSSVHVAGTGARAKEMETLQLLLRVCTSPTPMDSSASTRLAVSASMAPESFVVWNGMYGLDFRLKGVCVCKRVRGNDCSGSDNAQMPKRSYGSGRTMHRSSSVFNGRCTPSLDRRPSQCPRDRALVIWKGFHTLSSADLPWVPPGERASGLKTPWPVKKNWRARVIFGHPNVQGTL